MTAQTESLISRDIHARTQAVLENNDTAGMKLLVAEVLSLPHHEYYQSELVHAVLSADNFQMAKDCFDMRAIKKWCNANDEFLILNCVKVFSEWVESTADIMARIGRSLETLPAHERLEILEGRSSRVPGAFLYSSLMDTPDYWKCLTPVWLGKAGSRMREAALCLGWQSSMLRSMVGSFLYSKSASTWGDALDYPHSVSIAVFELNRVEGEERRLQKNKQQGMLWGKPRTMAQTQIECEKDANPWDVEMALELAKQTGFKHVLKPHADMSRIAPEDQIYLKSIVAMHLSLGCLGVLADALCNDTIPGRHESNNMAELPLPDMNTREQQS